MAPRGEMREKERHHDYSSNNSNSDDEELQHYDDIDLDSCDFQPFLTTQSGIALNYHTSDHPEHKILMQESFVEHNNHNDDGNISRYSQALQLGASRLFSILLIRPLSLVFETQERFQRRRVAFMGAIAFTGLLALWHVMNASQLLNFRVFTSSQSLAMPKPQSTTLRIESGIVPPQLQQVYRNVNDLPMEASDVIVYFEIPGGGAATNVTNILTKCFGLQQLQSMSHKDNAAPQTNSLVNTTVLVTTNIWETANRFNATLHRGRLVAIFQNPMDRLLIDYNRHAASHPDNSLTFSQYLLTVPDNLLVRSLVNVKIGPLTDKHLEMAKQLVQTKILVGLANKPTLSLERFQAHFQWKHDESRKDCTKNLPVTSRQSTNSDVEKDSPARITNRLDVQLYNYATLIFQQQAMISPR